MLIGLVNYIFQILNLLIILRVIISWVRPKTNNQTIYTAIKMVFQLTEPILEPIRRAIPSTGLGIDLSPIIAIFLLGFVRRLIFWAIL